MDVVRNEGKQRISRLKSPKFQTTWKPKTRLPNKPERKPEMGEAKNRKREIEALKAGKVIRLVNGYDDYDNAALVIKRAAKFVHEDLGGGSYGYNITHWMGVEIASDNDLKRVVKDCPLLCDDFNRVGDVKKAIFELLDIFSEQFMMDMLSPDGGKHPGRITNQNEMNNAVAFFFRPIYKGSYVAKSKPLNITTIHTKHGDSWNTAYIGSPNDLATLMNILKKCA